MVGMPIRWTDSAADRVFLALTILYAAGILALPLFPTQDGPHHLYYAAVQDAVMRDAGAFGGEFVVRRALPPYSFMTYFFIGATRLVSGVMAEKLLVVLYVVLFCLGFRYLMRTLYGTLPVVALLVFPFVPHTLVYLGFYNYNIGLAVMLFTCGFWLRNEERLRCPQTIVFALLVLLHLATHPVPLAAAAAFIAFRLLLTARNGITSGLVRGIAHLAFALAALAYATFYLSATGFREWSIGYPTWPERLVRLAKLHIVSPFESWALWAALVLAGCCLLAAALAAARQRPSERRGGAGDLLLLFGLACGAAAVLAPSHVSAWAHLDERFPALAVVFLLASAGSLDLPVKMRLPAGIGAGALACFVFVLDMEATLLYARTIEPLVEAPAIPAGARGVIVTKDHNSAFPSGARFSPCLWAPAHYFRRSKAVLLNAAWLDLPQIPMGVREYRSYHFLDPPAMAEYLIEGVASGNPDLPQRIDLMIAVDCRNGGANMPDISTVAERFGLERAAWSTAELAVYQRTR